MSSPHWGIWKKEPIQSALVFAVIGAMMGCVFSGLDTTWLLNVTFDSIMLAGLGATIGRQRACDGPEPVTWSGARCILWLWGLLAMCFVPIVFIWDLKTALVAFAAFGVLCGLVMCFVGHWILCKELVCVFRAISKKTSAKSD